MFECRKADGNRVLSLLLAWSKVEREFKKELTRLEQLEDLVCTALTILTGVNVVWVKLCKVAKSRDVPLRYLWGVSLAVEKHLDILEFYPALEAFVKRLLILQGVL